MQQCLSTRPSEQEHCQHSPLPILTRWNQSFREQLSHLWLEIDSTNPSQVSSFVALRETADPRRVCTQLFLQGWPERASSLLQEHRASYLGSMDSRPGAPLRIHVKLPKRELSDYLQAHSWPGSLETLQKTLQEISFCHKLTLCLELRDGTLSPNLGLEAAPDNSDWEPIWEQDMGSTHFSPQQLQLAKSWSSSQDPSHLHYPLPLLQRALQEKTAPLLLQRNVSHLKWSLDSKGVISRKLYLWFSEFPLQPGQLSGAQTRPTPSPSPPPTPLLKLLLKERDWTLCNLQKLEEEWGTEALQAAFRVLQTMRLLHIASSSS